MLRVFVLGRITPEALRQQVQAQMASHKPAHRDRSSVAGAIPGSGTGSLNSSMRTPGAAATLKLGQSGAQAAPDATAKGALSKTGTGTTPLNSARGQAGDKNATAGSKAATGKLEATTASAPGDTEGDQVTTSAAGMSLEDALLSSSNLYSTSECCLLAWLGHNLALAFPQLVGVHGREGEGPGVGASTHRCRCTASGVGIWCHAHSNGEACIAAVICRDGWTALLLLCFAPCCPDNLLRSFILLLLSLFCGSNLDLFLYVCAVPHAQQL